MTYDEFENYVLNGMYETIYDDSEGRAILVIRLLDAYALFNSAIRQEREACAMVCDEVESRADDLWNRHAYPEDQGMSMGASQCAEAIRARGNT